jgi:hypothetical protein
MNSLEITNILLILFVALQWLTLSIPNHCLFR